jgi:hypothetical protein
MKRTNLRLASFGFALLALAAGGLSCATADSHKAGEKKGDEEGFVTILGPGHTDGWTFDEDWIKIEDGVIVAGTMDKPIPKTMYAAHDKEYYNFELRAQAKAEGPEKTNGGFQIRSKYNADNGQMSGYQADMGFKYWGLVYDQSRRNRLLTKHEAGIDLKEDINWGEWNDYRVICKDNTIKVYINGKLFSQYTEKDEAIAKVKGVIGLQLHAGPPSVRYYRNIRIKELD